MMKQLNEKGLSLVIIINQLSSFRIMKKQYEKQSHSPNLEYQEYDSNRCFKSTTIQPSFRTLTRQNGQGSFPDHISMTSMKELQEKQLSIRSIRTAKNPSRSPMRLNLPNQTPNKEQFLRNATVVDQQLNQYANIQRILRNENDNLKMQNELLLKEVYKLKQSNRKYKQEYKKVTLEIEQVKLECQAQKLRADQMKEIIMSRLAQLESKINHENQDCENGNFGISECESILQALTLSESGAQ